HRARCTHLQTQPGRIQPIDSSQLAGPDCFGACVSLQTSCFEDAV
ncbi:hypothetical protein L557_2484, partial [Bordetella pertussis STO1-CNMC-0004]